MNLIKLSILLIFWIAAFYPVLPELMHTWLNSPNNSHGILVPFISAFLIWRKKDVLLKSPLSSMTMGLFILIVSMGLYLLAYTGSVAVISRLMIVFSLIGLVMFVFGKDVFREIWFPLFLLLFMVPVPDSVYGTVAMPLQLFATKVSTFIIQTVGIPAYREGNMVYFARTQLEVAEACSGLRSIMAYLMLGFLFAYLLENRGWLKAGFLVVSTVPLAIIANILRVTGTGILAHFYGDKVARGFLHEFSGLAVFALGFVMLFSEYLLLDKKKKKNNIQLTTDNEQNS